MSALMEPPHLLEGQNQHDPRPRKGECSEVVSPLWRSRNQGTGLRVGTGGHGNFISDEVTTESGPCKAYRGSGGRGGGPLAHAPGLHL